jgi:hypothetical protein
MYTTGTGGEKQRALGCFKGSKPGHEGSRMRGTIVPFPVWENISWVECTRKRPESFPKKAVIAPGIEWQTPGMRDGCPMFLTIARCKHYDFKSKRTGNSAFDDSDDEYDY